MSDDDMIRRGDAILAVTAADKECLGANGAREFIRALPAVQVVVKPLEWVEIRSGQYFEARVIGILYSVRLGSDGVVRWQAGHMGTWHEAPTIEAAKAAAQADYEARIRSAMTNQPSPDVAALTEAEIAQIEAGGKRWHGEAVQSYRWEPYKPDGQRQMKAKGRWQRQAESGDYWLWENCERPAALARVKGGA